MINLSSESGATRLLLVGGDTATRASLNVAVKAATAKRSALLRRDDAPDDQGWLDRDAERAEAPFDVEIVAGLREAIDRLAAERARGVPFALLVLAPCTDGESWDAALAARLFEGDPHLRIVVMANADTTAARRMATVMGAAANRLLIANQPYDASHLTHVILTLAHSWELARRNHADADKLDRRVAERTAELRHNASHDRLTGLLNRAGFNEHLALALADPATSHRGYALFFLDFDRFKLINDTLGHDAGDQLLINIADRLRHALSYDPRGVARLDRPVAGRLGGDEFVLFVPGAGEADALRTLADRLLVDLRAGHKILGRDVFSTPSIGITTHLFNYTKSDHALRDADVAMYRAKVMGKDRYVLFDPSMSEQIVARMKMETDLRAAIGLGELQLRFQPVYCLQSGQALGVEALVRWPHKDHVGVKLADFIQVAEETGLMRDIGQWVNRAALRTALQLQRQVPSKTPLFMSINLSARQLIEPGLVTALAASIDAAGIDPRTLMFEVPEGVAMSRLEVVLPALREMKKLGVRLSLDDFGSGHSSLKCLHEFPIDVLKIDGAFVRTMETKRQYSAVVQAIVTLAHNLGIQVAAEGVETAEQLAQLQALECDQAQGYFFTPPIEAGALIEMLSAAPRTVAAPVARVG